MKTYRIEYKQKISVVDTASALEAAVVAMRRWVTRSQAAFVNAWSSNPDGTGCYQAYTPARANNAASAVGGTIRVIGL